METCAKYTNCVTVPKAVTIEPRGKSPKIASPGAHSYSSTYRYILTNSDLRKLGKGAISLLRTLYGMQERRNGPFCARLDHLAKRLNIAYRTIQYQLRKLRDCGAVRVKRTRKHKWGKNLVLNWFIIEAKIENNTFSIPYHLWEKRKDRKKENKANKAEINIPTNKDLKSYAVLDNKSCASAQYKKRFFSLPSIKNKVFLCMKDKKTNESRSGLSYFYESEGVMGNKKQDLIIDKLFGELDQIVFNKYKKQNRPLGLPPTLPARKAIKRINQNHEPIPVHLISPVQKVQFLVTAYRQAIYITYGIKSYAFTNGDIRKFKFFKSLIAAADILQELVIPPVSWAEWLMGNMRKRDKFLHKAPPITLVFSANNIKKRHGWFHNDYDPPTNQYIITNTHREQHYRIKEARRYWRNSNNPLIGMPRWYINLREKEIANGYTDPLYLYPK